MRRTLIFLFLGCVMAAPMVVSAQNPIVPNCSPNCGWADLIQLGQNILNFIVMISVWVGAIMFAYAGWLFFSDTGNSSNIEQGKKVFGAVVVGLIIVLTAWLVINTIIETFTGESLDQRANTQEVRGRVGN